MLELKKITKVYKTSTLVQKALDNINLNFRTSEFAFILGPSGSGKTTLLNIIGGLDHYTSGDLIINGVSTKKYNDRSWDTYRNKKVGFVFQSYNLIPHQTVLKNVELALTISGVSKKERIKRSKKVLREVGLQEHIYKKPLELSGGQMQRVAIARALVNNPDILLADEPTGALDSKTSIQIMKLLKDISKDKLVIMVSHNAELADKYATRVINLKDGIIIKDTNPYKSLDKNASEKKAKKKKMSLTTALSLSLNNLLTKKVRTLLTSFAGSIGIVGIALIISLSHGLNNYINNMQKETISNYPITINEIDNLSNSDFNYTDDVSCNKNSICTIDDITKAKGMNNDLLARKNNLRSFKEYLDNNGDNINNYISSIKYSYDIALNIYDTTSDIVKVNPGSIVNADSNAVMLGYNVNAFQELPVNYNKNKNYKLLNGKMPSSKDEVVLVVDNKRRLPLSLLYNLNIKSKKELDNTLNDVKNKKIDSIKSENLDYDMIIGKTYKLVLNSSFYKKEYGVYKDMSLDLNYIKDLANNGLELKIVGVIKTNEDLENGYIGYTNELTKYVINENNNSAIVNDQKSNKDINVFTNSNFDGDMFTYENNLKLMGSYDLDNPTSISLYPKNFNSKKQIEDIIKKYNKDKKDDDKITYVDFIGILISSITSMVDVISYILIAFVGVSLIVSSIMIAIITYISVLERTKEIGVLRAIGASKKDVSRVFNAETIIEGAIAGLLGVGITLLLNVPINAIIYSLIDVKGISKLPINAAIILIVISIVLTLVAGLIPSKIASKKDPVKALRSE